MSDSKTLEFLKGMLIGGAVGAVAGLLLAPRPGRETREVLQKSLDEFYEQAETSLGNARAKIEDFEEDAERLAKEAKEFASGLSGEAEERVSESASRLLEALDAAREAFKAVRGGKKNGSVSEEPEQEV